MSDRTHGHQRRRIGPVHVLKRHDDGRGPAKGLENVHDPFYDKMSHIGRRRIPVDARRRPPRDQPTDGSKTRIIGPSSDTEGVRDRTEGSRPFERVRLTSTDSDASSARLINQLIDDSRLPDTGLALDDQPTGNAIEQGRHAVRHGG